MFESLRLRMALLGISALLLAGGSVFSVLGSAPIVSGRPPAALWKLSPCGLPAWFFNGGVFGPVRRSRQARAGTAYGRPIHTISGKDSHKLDRRALVLSLVLAARDHYAPMRSLCVPGLVGNLNSYCVYELHDWQDKHKRLLHSIAARVITTLRSIRNDYLKRPPSVSDLGAVRSTFQRDLALADMNRVAGRQVTAELVRDAYILEYPSVAAIDWRIATFQRWPLATAIDWQAGMVTMQFVAAARNILKKNPLIVVGATSALHWPVSLGKSSMTRMDRDQASRCMSVASAVIEEQVIADIKLGLITINDGPLRRKILSELRSESRNGRHM